METDSDGPISQAKKEKEYEKMTSFSTEKATERTQVEERLSFFFILRFTVVGFV